MICARRTRRSRSRLFTDALREYLARHAPDKVTESMYEAMMEIGEAKDEFVSSKARRKLERTEWRSLRDEIWWEDLSARTCSDPGFADTSCRQYRTKGTLLGGRFECDHAALIARDDAIEIGLALPEAAITTHINVNLAPRMVCCSGHRYLLLCICKTWKLCKAIWLECGNCDRRISAAVPRQPREFL